MAKNARIDIQHIATGLFVDISDYKLTEFQDSINTQYNTVQTFGRMDPIVNYQGATRKISLGIKMDTTSGDDDRDAIHLVSTKLMKMQYPVYQRSANALTIQRPPIVAVSLGNLIRDGNGGPLICAMNGFAFTPSTGFTPENSPFVRFGGRETIAAITGSNSDVVGFKEYNFKFDFTVLHQSPLGFQDGSTITDPDTVGPSGSTGYANKAANMRFLGGYNFGPRDAVTHLSKHGSVADPTTNQVYSSEPDGSGNNVQNQANIENIFKDLGFGG